MGRGKEKAFIRESYLGRIGDGHTMKNVKRERKHNIISPKGLKLYFAFGHKKCYWYLLFMRFILYSFSYRMCA